MSTISAQPGAEEHGHGHGHDHPPFLAHHFDTPQQQFESGKLGMWLFLATEVLFFGGLFVWYAVLRSLHPEIFLYASGYLDTLLGGVNTCVLILSSLTMAMAVRYAQLNRRTGLVVCLLLTLLGAVGFLGIKYVEYTHKFHEHLLWGGEFYVLPEGEHLPESEIAQAREAAVAATMPGAGMQPLPANHPLVAGVPPVEASAIRPAAEGPQGLSGSVIAAETGHGAGGHDGGGHGAQKRHGPHLADPDLPRNTHLFFGVYFAMTGLHAVHVIVGMIVIGWLIRRAVRGDFSSDYYTPVDLGGLYWHIVDLVWIFLFPLFYIIH